MPKITYENRVCAFIDIIGFGALVDDSANSISSMEILEKLVNMLETAIPNLNQKVDPNIPPRLIPKHILISDAIVLSAPVCDLENPTYNGLSIIIMRCIQLSHYFLELGYLLRGGITVGNVCHREMIIVGPAYQEAYKLEQNNSHPSIILSEFAQRLWMTSVEASSRMCVNTDGKLMVNGLHDFYLDIANQSISGKKIIYEKYISLVEERLKSDLQPERRAKWEWFKYFIDSEMIHVRKWLNIE